MREKFNRWRWRRTTFEYRKFLCAASAICWRCTELHLFDCEGTASAAKGFESFSVALLI